MSLHPQVKFLLDKTNTGSQTPWKDRGIERSRQLSGMVTNFAGRREPVGGVENFKITGRDGHLISVRLYRPSQLFSADSAPLAEKLPVLVYAHGGGWIMGDLETTDVPLRLLTNRSGCAFLAVDYRLSPEHKFPAALEDMCDVVAWLTSNGERLGLNPARIAIAGDSAGGNIAAATALRLRDEGELALYFQLLIYPALGMNFSAPSYQSFGEGHGLTVQDSYWFWEQYLNLPADIDRPYAVPLDAPNLSNLPPTLVVTSEYDVLRSEAEQYAANLQAAGVSVELQLNPSLAHGFLQMVSFVEPVKAVISEIASKIRTAMLT